MIEFPDSSFDRAQQHFPSIILNWLIDWRMRRAVSLSSWIKKQVDNPTQELIDYANTIQIGKNHDETMMNVFLKVVRDISYISDDKKWETPETWATAHETLTLTTTTSKGTFYPAMSGDCEDGAILMYVLCRLKGMPANRLLLFAGDVKGGGHCWLGYKPTYAPWIFCFMDWCYWVSRRNIIDRDKFFVKEVGTVDVVFPEGTNYINVWFAFNENVAYNRFKLQI